MSDVKFEEKQQRIIDVGEVEQFDFVFVNAGSALKQITKDRFVAFVKEMIGNGKDGVGISEIEQTTTSTEDDGINVVTITLTNNEKYTYQFQNGSKGNDGITPHIGENGNWFIGENDTGVSASGGTAEAMKDYRELENKPSINGVELTGNKTSQELGFENLTDEQVSDAVDEWLNEHPEATTTVEDGSINPDKTTWLRQIYHNIFDASTITDGRYFFSNSNDNTTGGGTADYFVSDYIQVEAGKKYLFSHKNMTLRWVDADKVFISGSASSLTSRNVVVEAPDNAHYVRFSVAKSSATPDTAQVYEYIGEVWEYDTYKNLYDIRISSDSYTTALVELVGMEIKNGNIDIGDLISLENIPFSKIEGFEEYHWQLVDSSKLENGTLNGKGEETSGTSAAYVYFRTPFIPVTEGETLHHLWNTVYGYDSEGNFVSELKSTEGISTVPEGVTQIRVCDYDNVNSNAEPVINVYRRGYGKHDLRFDSAYDYSHGFPIFKSEDGKNGFKSYLGIYPWTDKSFCFIGDSFTAPGVWNRNMVNNLKGKYNGSEAVSGGAFAYRDTVPKTAYKQAQNLVTNGLNPDVILITLGTNDSGNNVTIGDITYSNNIADFDLTTYTGGMQACLNYLQNNFPNAIIYIGWTPMGGLTSVSNAYIERMKEVALMYGIEYIETRTCGVTKYSDIYADCYENGVNGGHPTTNGQNKIAEYMTRLMSGKK